MKYYYSVANKPLGPIPLEELHALYQNGVITLETLVVPEGGKEWKAYSTLNPPPKDLSPPAPVSTPAVGPSAVAPSTAIPAATSTPGAAAPSATPPFVSPSNQPGYKNLVLISWILLGLTALVSVIPVLGCFSWVMLIPVFIATIAMAIVILNRGGQRDGILILVASIVVLPAFTILAPIVTTALFGTVTGIGKTRTTAATPAPTAAPRSVTTPTPAPAAPSIARAVAENPATVFQKLDATQNGYLSGTEMKGYEGYDANKDNRVTQEEFVAGSERDTRLKAISETLDQFLVLLNGGRYEESFDAAAPSFRTDLTKADYVANLKKIRGPFGKATNHELKTIDTKTDLGTGQKTYVIPVASTFEKGNAIETITVVQEADRQYRVSDYSLTIESSSAQPKSPGEAGKDVPNETVALQMINDTMLNFKNAVNSADFGPFYRTQLSDLWKKQTTPAKLKTNFKSFIDKKIDLSGIFSVQPVLDEPPHIDSDGLLVLKGHYPLVSQKVNVTYELFYSREAKWGLSGINVKIKPVSE